MFPALMPHTLSRTSHITADFARTELPDHFDLAIGNPPFSDRTAATRAAGGC